jgi:20S proteasome alpha/beta subunit
LPKREISLLNLPNQDTITRLSSSPRRRNALTVGIGAICENGKAAVVAADKMVTFGNPMNLQTEPPALKKIIELTERTLMVFSGSTADGEEIVTGAKPSIAVNPRQPVKSIAEAVKESYSKHKQRRVEDNILRPLLGADFAQFQTLVAQSPTSQVLQQVLGLIMQHNLNTDLLVAGLDDSGAHVFVITHPGQLLPLATTGFGSVGSGAVHAGVRMSLAQHTSAASLVDTLYNVYEAKRASEVAPGVGKLTDLALIQDGHIFFAGPDMLKALENSHKEKPALTKHEQEALKKVCDECTKKQSDATTQSGTADAAA